MSHHDHIDYSITGCCAEPMPRGVLMKDPWECYEGDTDACAPEPAETPAAADTDCGCCCC